MQAARLGKPLAQLMGPPQALSIIVACCYFVPTAAQNQTRQQEANSQQSHGELASRAVASHLLRRESAEYETHSSSTPHRNADIVPASLAQEVRMRVRVGDGKSSLKVADEPQRGVCRQSTWREWSDCSQGRKMGKMKASENQINSVDACAQEASKRCPQGAQYISYSPFGQDDVCAWFRECDLGALDLGDSEDDLSHYFSVHVWADNRGHVKFASDEWPGMADCFDCKLPLENLIGSSANPVMLDKYITSNSWRSDTEDQHKYGWGGKMSVARLGDQQASWCGKKKDEMSTEERQEQQYLMFEFQDRTFIKEMLTHGDTNENFYVNKFTIMTSDDGKNWYPYSTHLEGKKMSQAQTFRCSNGGAPCSPVAPARVSLDPPMSAKFVKILIKDYVGYPCLRVELLGCGCKEPPSPLHFEPTALPDVRDEKWFK